MRECCKTWITQFPDQGTRSHILYWSSYINGWNYSRSSQLRSPHFIQYIVCLYILISSTVDMYVTVNVKVIHAWICVTQVTCRMGVITVHGVFGGCFISSVLVSLLLATNSAIPPGLFSGTLVPLLQLQTMLLTSCLRQPCACLWSAPWFVFHVIHVLQHPHHEWQS